MPNSARARIELADRGDGPEVTVSDDGVGGAVVAGGTGLRGLVDRVEALGGSISIDSRPGSRDDDRRARPVPTRTARRRERGGIA